MKKKKNALLPTNEQLQKIVGTEKAEMKKIQCFEVHNLYIDTKENREMTKNVLKVVKENINCTYAYALHDNDFYVEDTFNQTTFELIGKKGEKKKPHYHLYVVLVTPLPICDIAKKLNVKQSQIQKFNLKHFRNKILYLTHICYEPTEKTRYEKEIIKSNCEDFVKSVYENYNPSMNIIQLVLDYTEENKTNKLMKRDFIKLCMQHDMYADVRKMYSICKDIIEEHNANANTYLERSQAEYATLCKQVKDKLNLLTDVFDICDTMNNNTEFNYNGQTYEVVKKVKKYKQTNLLDK